jgi:hypothetical protein
MPRTSALRVNGAGSDDRVLARRREGPVAAASSRIRLPYQRGGMIAVMNHGFGIERPAVHHPDEHRTVARYLVLIESGGPVLALLFTEKRDLVANFDAGAEEVALMTRGLRPAAGANGPEWDLALAGQSLEERAAASVYTLDV